MDKQQCPVCVYMKPTPHYTETHRGEEKGWRKPCRANTHDEEVCQQTSFSDSKLSAMTTAIM